MAAISHRWRKEDLIAGVFERDEQVEYIAGFWALVEKSPKELAEWDAA